MEGKTVRGFREKNEECEVNRRSFLKVVVALTGLAALKPSALLSAPPPRSGEAPTKVLYAIRLRATDQLKEDDPIEFFGVDPGSARAERTEKWFRVTGVDGKPHFIPFYE